MNILDQLLSRIKTFELTAEDYFSKNTFIGKGNCRIIRTDNSVELNCKGMWKDKNNHSLFFTFSYRFIFGEKTNEILVEHTRYGRDNSVYLCRLRKLKPKYFISEKPHLCENDNYSAALSISDKNLNLTWDISGPNKKMKLNYKFS